MKRVLWLIVLAAALIAAVLGAGRWQVERLNRTVEIVYDLPGLLEVAESLQRPIENLLADLRQADVNSVAIQPETLGERLLRGQPPSDSLAKDLPADMTELGRLLVLPVAFRPQDFSLLNSSGLKPVPKLTAVSWDLEPVWLAQTPSLLILSGNREFRRAELHNFDGRLALVEFHTPGTSQLEDRTDRMVRLHGISAGEMENLPAERIITRYLRGVRERNIRVLYLRPFTDGEDAWERSLDLLANLRATLERGGYILGEAQSFAPWNPALVWRLLVSAGIWAGAVLYGLSLFPKSNHFLGLAGILGWVTTVGAAWYFPVLVFQGLALVAAVIFPCLALRCNRSSRPWLRYWTSAGISLLGALLIVGTLTGPEYLLKILEFRGVKLMHILPVLLVIFSLIRPLKTWFNKKIPVRHLVLAGLVGLLGIFYVLRTGNFGLPVPSWEVKMREGLEQILRTRPRTKEFLVGHPAFFLALHSKYPERSWWLPIAVVGQVSLVNTFTHIHSPLSISLLRTLYGLIFGYFFGWLFSLGLHLGKRWLQGDHRIGLLRVRQSGR